MDGANIPPPQVVASFNQFEQRQSLPQNPAPNLLNQVQNQLASLPSNTTIYTTVLASDKSGNSVVKIAGSELVLSSPIALDKGSQLALKVDSGSGSVTLQLVSVDGKLPATQPQANSNQLQDPNHPPVFVKIINVLQGGQQQVAGQPAQAQQAARAESVIIGSQNASSVKGVIISAPPEVMQTIKSTIYLNLPKETAKTTAESLPDKLKIGSEASFKVISVQPNTSQQEQEFTPEIKFTADGRMRINAQVIGANNNDEILVQTPMGKVVLDSPAPNMKLPQGSVISLEFEGFVNIPDGDEKGGLQTIAKTWPSLVELASHSANPNAMLHKLAGLDGLFAARIIGFINAVKNNKFEDWISSELQKELDGKGSEEVMTKLKAEFGNIRQMLTEGPSNNWQAIFLPVFDGEELRQAKLFVKYLKDENGKRDKKAGTRFVVELETGFFGDMQFDGLVRNFTPSKNFDLVIRTKTPLEQDVKQDIAAIFNSSAEITGIKGALEFAVLKDFPIHALDQKLSAQRHENFEA